MDGFKFNAPNMTEMYARRFVEAKQRLPQSQRELYEWLMEFDAAMIKLIDHLQQLYTEHQMICTRPLIIKIEKPSPRQA